MRYALLLVAAGSVTAYDESRALDYAKLAGASYCPDNELQSWSCGDKCIAGVTDVSVCQGSSTKSFVARWDAECIVSFEGTNNVQSLIQDLEFLETSVSWDICENCKVHGGFLSEWLSLKECVESSLTALGCGAGSSIRTTGHSLGAAIDGLAMMSLETDGWTISESYNFGMPRTGDQNFAKAFNARFSDRFFRVTHHMDPVVQLPPDQLIVDWHFMHVEPEVFYNGDVSAGSTECSSSNDKNCAEQYWNLPIDAFHVEDHLDYMGTSTSTSGCANANTQMRSGAGMIVV